VFFRNITTLPRLLSQCPDVAPQTCSPPSGTNQINSNVRYTSAHGAISALRLRPLSHPFRAFIGLILNACLGSILRVRSSLPGRSVMAHCASLPSRNRFEGG
jgi:hypothetical protein